MKSSFSPRRGCTRTGSDLSGIGLESSSRDTRSETNCTSLPDLRNIEKPQDRKKWYGFLKTIVSVNQLIGKPGLYAWYKWKSLNMKESLKRHIRQNLPSGSIEKFNRAIFLASHDFRWKHTQGIYDEAFILAELRKLDQNTSVVVRIPEKDFASILNLYALQGYTNEEIAKLLGLSMETVNKVNPPGLSRTELTGDFKKRIKEVLLSRHLRGLLRKTEVDDVSISDHLRVIKYCEEQLEKAAKQAPGGLEGEDAETQRILSRHRRLIEQYGLNGKKENADHHDEQDGETGGTESRSEARGTIRDLGPGGDDLPGDREPPEDDGP